MAPFLSLRMPTITVSLPRPTPSLLKAAALVLAAPVLSGHLAAVSGGLSQMNPFLVRNFPTLQADQNKTIADHHQQKADRYCRLSDGSLATYGISHHITATIAAPFATFYVARNHRHKGPILVGALLAFGGAFLQLIPTRVHHAMPIAGRLVQGIGFGFLNQAHSYLAEMAPEDCRVPLVFLAQGCTKAGAVLTNLQNYLTAKYGNEGDDGWRMSLLLIPLVLTVILMYAYCVLPDTPHRLILVSNDEAGARRLLKRIRETTNDDDVQKEVDAIREGASMETTTLFGSLKLLKKEHIPPLVTGTVVAILTQLVGANMTGPIMVQALGFSSETALLFEIFRSLLDLPIILLMRLFVDKIPRKVLLTVGGIGVLVSLVLIGAVEASGLEGTWSHDALCFIAIIIFERGFAATWAPLAVLIPSEIYPSEIQPLGQGLSALASSISAALIGRFYIPQLCRLKYGIFFVLAAVQVVAIVWVRLLLPETSEVLPEKRQEIWSGNRFWKRFMPKENHDEESATTDSPTGTSFSSTTTTNYTSSSSDDTTSVSSLSEAGEHDHQPRPHLAENIVLTEDTHPSSG